MNNTFAKELQKIRKSQKALTIFVLLFVLVIVWGVVTLFSAQRETKIDTEVLMLAKPLNPVIDTAHFAKMQLKRSFTDTELANFPIYQLLTNEKTREEVVVPIGVTKKDLSTQSEVAPSPTTSTQDI
ncbi:MAG: hypothetical protein O2840_02245 [bacterium]|nr:hypothetical protein [bacterium]